MVDLKHYDDCGTARFITFSCYHRYRLFNKKYIFELFLKHLESLRKLTDISLLGYVIMPNHVHLVILPQTEISIGGWIGRLKLRFAREIIPMWKKMKNPRLRQLKVIRGGKEMYAFWQVRCYDHNCRTPEAVIQKIRYCHRNPVRAGLVTTPEEWRWSSYRWYQGEREGIVTINDSDLSG